MEMKIIFEDEDIMVVDKPAGILVHPTLAREKNTLVDFLKSHIPGLEKLNWPDPKRPGIVHRLDKDTSGLIIIAKTLEILTKLQGQFKNRQVKKIYLALVLGKIIPKEGKIEAALIRSKAGTQKVQEIDYAISKIPLRPALTFYKIINQYKFKNDILTLVEVTPKTGRMHQIRIHLKYIGYPIVGDQLYNTKSSRKISKELNLHRQFLHAQKIEFRHPASNNVLKFESNLPKKLIDILAKLEKI